jgi:hypothetical protein
MQLLSANVAGLKTHSCHLLPPFPLFVGRRRYHHPSLFLCCPGDDFFAALIALVPEREMKKMANNIAPNVYV